MKRKKVKILVGICSCVKAKERRQAVRETWMKEGEENVECLFFVGGNSPLEDEMADLVVLDAPDGYHELPHKVLEFFKYALEHYDFDWLFKCDDDTYLRLDRLPELCDPKYDLIGDALVERRLSPSGGAGYLLSRKIVEKIVKVPDFPLCGAEDVIVGELVYKLGGKLYCNTRLYLANACYPDENNDMVSAHWCSPELLRGIYYMTRFSPATVYHGKDVNWEDEIHFFANGFFRKTATSCYGQWSLGARGELSLKWQMWTEEQYLELEGLYIGSKTILSKKAGLPSLQDIVLKHTLPVDPSLEGDKGLKVHLGSGDRFLPGWLNLDAPHYDIAQILPWENREVFSYYLEGVLEKTSCKNAVRFFKEAFRTLVPEGVLRICYTDFLEFHQQFTAEYRQKTREKYKRTYLPDHDIELLSELLGHQTFYSLQTMVHLLELTGFEVQKVQYGQSDHPHLKNLEKESSDKEFLLELTGRKCIECVKPEKARDLFTASRGEERSYVTPRFIQGHRTGNRLFQIAAVYAHALRHGLECRVPWHHNLEAQQIYKVLGKAADCCPDGGYSDETTYREPAFSYSPIPPGVRRGALEGFFQSEKYFSDVDQEIRYLFRNLTGSPQERIAGVHIRMGDYLERENMYHVPDRDFLETAFQGLSDNIRELVVFSDSPHKAYKLVQSVQASRRFEITIDTNDTLEALKRLSCMQELVLSCSSFSWWGAYLGNQEKVFIQGRWFSGVIHDDQDVYRERWIRL